MARSTNPLDRETIGVAAQLPSARFTPPRTNAALQLADALKDAAPEARGFMQQLAQGEAEKQRSQARQDALKNAGQSLADAVRAGKIDATQNPWYIQAYNRESASIQSLDALQRLQTESASWEEYNDPDAFAARWREEAGKLGEGFTTKDQQAGYQAAEGQVTSQVLQENVARNVARIKAERVDNLSQLTTDALQSAYRSNGGTLSPNQAVGAIEAAQSQWFHTGGSEHEWQQMLVKSVTSLAYATQDSSLLDLLKAPELLHGPSEAGNGAAGQGSLDGSTFNPPHSTLVPPGPDAPEGAKPTLQVQAPVTKLAQWPVSGAHITSQFGARSAPKAGASTNHRGIDLAVPVGTPVSAQATGKVVSVKDEGKLGNTVRIDYGNGVVGIYGHLSAFNVKEGEVVSAGQVVAKSGASGNVTGPHVHYQLMVNGKATNPQTYTGTVGGTFEADPAQAAAPQFPGFPSSTDAPFQAGQQLPGNVINRGPSLYGLPGVADQVESDRYRINEAAAAAPLQRARVIKAQREARGLQGSDILWQTFGTGLLTGAVTRDQIIDTLGKQNFSGPEIAEAMQNVNSVLRDSVGVANAQVAARSQNPGNALDVLDIVSDAHRTGWTPQLEKRVGQAILRGDLSGNDGEQIISAAVSASNAQRSEARAEARYQDQQEQAGGVVHNATGLRQSAGYLRDLVVQTIAQTNPGKATAIRNPKVSKALMDRITTAMGAWIAANPGDYEGALQAGKDAANKAILEMSPRPGPRDAKGNQIHNPLGR